MGVCAPCDLQEIADVARVAFSLQRLDSLCLSQITRLWFWLLLQVSIKSLVPSLFTETSARGCPMSADKEQTSGFLWSDKYFIFCLSADTIRSSLYIFFCKRARSISTWVEWIIRGSNSDWYCQRYSLPWRVPVARFLNGCEDGLARQCLLHLYLVQINFWSHFFLPFLGTGGSCDDPADEYFHTLDTAYKSKVTMIYACFLLCGKTICFSIIFFTYRNPLFNAWTAKNMPTA